MRDRSLQVINEFFEEEAKQERLRKQKAGYNQSIKKNRKQRKQQRKKFTVRLESDFS